MTNKTLLLRNSFLGIGVLLVLALGGHHTRLVLNQSHSLPYKIFLVVKGKPFKRGECVSILGHHPAYISSNLGFIKRVSGVAGDRISITQGALFINGRPKGRLRPFTKNHQPLTPLRTEEIPEGYVFVQGSAWDSYDSRYEEFGLVKVEHIQGKAWGFWKEEENQ